MRLPQTANFYLLSVRSRATLSAIALSLAFGLLTFASRGDAADLRQTDVHSTVHVRLDNVYYELPRWCVGVKLTAYAVDFAGSDPKNASETTPDGKNWLACIKDMKLGFIGASMGEQGLPPNKGRPNRHFADWCRAADAVVQSGGGVMIEYQAGPRGMPKATKLPPEQADNVDDGEWSPQNCLDWTNYMASRDGADKIRLFEFYNEPACMNNRQSGTHGPCWYSFDDFKNAWRPCSDWATNHQQDYYKAVKTKYPDAVVCGSSFSAPASSYGAGEGLRYLQGYPGARVSATNPNTKYQDALSLHSYGFGQGAKDANTPTAPTGRLQAIFNSIFYPTYKEPGKISGYKAGVDQWIDNARRLPGGKTNRLVNTEWWGYDPKTTRRWGPVGDEEGSHQAVADVLGLIVHCQNADRWLFDAIEYHAANVAEGRNTDGGKRPDQIVLTDCIFAEHQGKIWRSGRYFAIKDICARFGNNYPRLVRCDVVGPPSPAGPRNNSPGTQIQSCAGLSRDKSSLAICLANIGDSKQTIEIAFDRPAAGAVSAVKIPTRLDVETPLSKLSALPFADQSHKAALITLEGYTAALVDVPLDNKLSGTP